MFPAHHGNYGLRVTAAFAGRSNAGGEAQVKTLERDRKQKKIVPVCLLGYALGAFYYPGRLYE